MIALNSEVTPADNSFLHVDMMSFLQLIACSFYSPTNRDGSGRIMKHEFKHKTH